MAKYQEKIKILISTCMYSVEEYRTTKTSWMKSDYTFHGYITAAILVCLGMYSAYTVYKCCGEKNMHA